MSKQWGSVARAAERGSKDRRGSGLTFGRQARKSADKVTAGVFFKVVRDPGKVARRGGIG